MVMEWNGARRTIGDGATVEPRATSWKSALFALKAEARAALGVGCDDPDD